jgi:hypothetical protein
VVRRKIQIVEVLVVLLPLAAMLIQITSAASLETVLPVSYRSQETAYYCGPAVVQMALSYVAAEVPSQDTLASEMDTDPAEGVTYTDMIRVPFEIRGFHNVYEASLDLETLREANDNAYLTIILIYFSPAHVYQHYVLVIGYNSSGIFVHDPWPLTASQPEGRSTGANAFISIDLLTDLWTCDPSHWGLVIPYSNTLDEGPPWWQRHWYLLIALPAVAVTISVIALVKKKKSATEDGDAVAEA